MPAIEADQMGRDIMMEIDTSFPQPYSSKVYLRKITYISIILNFYTIKVVRQSLLYLGRLEAPLSALPIRFSAKWGSSAIKIPLPRFFPFFLFSFFPF